MGRESVPVTTINFNLKVPCADCPFRKDVPCHEGVASDLISIWGKIEQGQFAHSCHKTDPRSDGFIEGYDKTPEHCVGALLMLKGMGETGIQDFWHFSRATKKIAKLKPHPMVFKDLTEMIKHYANHLQDESAFKTGLAHSCP